MSSKRIRRRILISQDTSTLLGVALILRLALVLHALLHLGPAWFFARGSEMGFLAVSLLHGQGLSSPFGVPTGPTAIVAPGYPLLVAAVFRVLGSYTRAAALCLMLLNTGCNIVTVYAIFRLGQMFTNRRAAAMTSMFWACSLPLIWMPTICWETSLSCLLGVGVVVLMLSSYREHSTHFWFGSGGLCGLTGLLNPALLPALLTLTLYTLFYTSPKSRRWLHLATAISGLVILFSPWPIRNMRTLHVCVLSRTTVGLELWMGNRPGSTGFLEPALFPTNNTTELESYQHLGEVDYMNRKGKLARTYIGINPARFAILSCERFLRFWTGSGTRGGSVLFSLHATTSSLLGLGGLILLRRRGNRRACVSIGVVLLLFPLPYYFTHAEFRYRLVLDPLLCASAAPALELLLTTMQSAAKARSPMLPV